MKASAFVRRVVWGIIALLGALVAIRAFGSSGVSGSGFSVQVAIDYGLYVTILGSLLLIVGSGACALGSKEG